MPELKTVVPDRFFVMAQPQPLDLDSLARQGFRMLVNNRPDGEQQGQPQAAEMRKSAEELGLRYIHIPVEAGTISRRDVEAFHDALSEGPHPAVAYCGSGRRSFLLWATGEVLNGRKSEEELINQASAIGIDAGPLGEIVQRVHQTG